MILAVWVMCCVLGALAYLEPRSRLLLALMALVAAQTAYIDALGADRLVQIAARLPIDFAAGWLACWGVQRREHRWVAAGFVVSCVLHATFWAARHVGIDLWLWYAYSLNIIFLAQLSVLAIPGGTRLARELAYRLCGPLAWMRGLSGGRLEEEGHGLGKTSNIQPDVRTGRKLLLHFRRA